MFFRFLIFLSLLFFCYSNVTPAGTGNCGGISLNFGQTTCLQYGGIITSTNISSNIILATGALEFGFFISSQPNCNNYHATNTPSTIYPSTVTPIYEITNTEGIPLVSGIIFQCKSLKPCNFNYCNTFSPYSSSMIEYNPKETVQSISHNSYRILDTLLVDYNPNTKVYFEKSPQQVSEYISFKYSATSGVRGSCDTYNYIVEKDLIISCNDPPTPIIEYSSANLQGVTLYFQNCANGYAYFSFDDSGKPVCNSKCFNVTLESYSFGANSCSLLGCCQINTVQIFNVITNS